jgi:PAS domain S-box-containing protein
MKAKPLLSRTKGPLAVAIIYALFGAAWIAFSDEFVASNFHDPLTIKHYSIYKGLAYVVVTAVLVYLLVKGMEARLKRYVNELASANDDLRNEMDSRKQAEDSLRESDRKLRTLLDNMPDMIARFDREAHVLFANPAVCRAFGVAPEELLGKAIHQYHIPGDEDQNTVLENMLHRAFDEGHPCRAEIQLRTTNGPRVFDVLHIPERDKDGKVVCVLGVAHDVTDEKKADEELWRSSQMLKLVMDNMPNSVFWKDSNSVFLGCNHLFAQDAGLASPDAIIGLTDLDMPWKDTEAEGYRADDKMVMLTGQPKVNYEETQHTPDGRMIWLRTSKIPLKDLQGNVIGVMGAYEDITTRKKAEAALWESSQMLKLVLDNMPAFVFWKDRNSVYLGCNNRFAANAGLSSPEKIVGLTDLDLPWRDTEAASYRADDKLVMDSGSPKFNYEETQHTATGRVTWVTTSKVPLKDPDGKVIGILGTFEDITDRKTAEVQRESLLRELAEKNNELKSIVYISSHDLRSPIINILGFSAQVIDNARDTRTLLADQPLADDVRRKLDAILNQEMPQAIGFIKNSAEKMSALVGALLKLSRIGALTMTIVQVNANDLVRRLINAMQYQLRKTGASVTVDPLPSCMADEIQLSQVFSNLIDNALKYIHPQRKPQIRISGRRDGKEVIYSVSDNGIGISPAYHSKVFELFHRLNPDETASGEGVGLTIVSNIITRHHGRVWLESTPGEGSIFYFSLPAA